VATATKNGRPGRRIARCASAPSLVQSGDLESHDEAEHAERSFGQGGSFSGKAVNQ
jgi:hypothetical protein